MRARRTIEHYVNRLKYGSPKEKYAMECWKAIEKGEPMPFIAPAKLVFHGDIATKRWTKKYDLTPADARKVWKRVTELVKPAHAACFTTNIPT